MNHKQEIPSTPLKVHNYPKENPFWKKEHQFCWFSSMYYVFNYILHCVYMSYFLVRSLFILLLSCFFVRFIVIATCFAFFYYYHLFFFCFKPHIQSIKLQWNVHVCFHIEYEYVFSICAKQNFFFYRVSIFLVNHAHSNDVNFQ